MKNETANALVCLFLVGMMLAGGGEAIEGAKTEPRSDSAVERRADCPPGNADRPAGNFDR